MILRPFTICNFKNSAVYSSCECPLSKATGNSESECNIRDYRIYQYSGNLCEKVVLYLLKYGHTCYVLILLEMD